MKHKNFYIIGGCCIAMGVFSLAGGLYSGAWETSLYLDYLGVYDNEYNLDDNYDTILVETSGIDVVFQSGESFVIEGNNMDLSAFQIVVSDTTLYLTATVDLDDWLPFQPDAVITITLPENAARTISAVIEEGTGTATGVTASTLTLDLDEGDITLEDCTLNSCTAQTEDGDLEVQNLSVDGTAILETNAGDIHLDTMTTTRGCRVSSGEGECLADEMTCGYLELELLAGEATLTNLTTTEEDAESTLTLDQGTLTLEAAELWNVQCTLGTGNAVLEDTQLSGENVFTLSQGDVIATLRGSESDYTTSEDGETWTGDGETSILGDFAHATQNLDVTYTD